MIGVSKKNLDRDRKIYDMRVNQLMTLTAISKRFGLTRERVRQIVLSFSKATEINQKRADALSNKANDARMLEIGSSRRVVNLIKRLRAEHLTPKEFVREFTPNAIKCLPSIGKNTFAELLSDLEEFDPDVTNFWTTRNG